jgi:hypothetical protein
MKNSEKLTNEINALKEKRAQLQTEIETAEGAHTEAREGLVQTGGVRSVETVTVAHSRLVALREAINTLDSQIADKDLQLKEAEAQEERHAALDRIAEIQGEREEVRKDYLAARERANKALQAPLNEMKAAKQRWANLVAEENKLSASLGPAGRVSDRFASPLLEPFGVQIDQAFYVLGRIEEKADRKARSQKLAEQRRVRESATRAA